MASPGPMNPETVAVQVKRLINTQLKQVLKYSGLPVSGAKATLQTRIIDQLHAYERTNNIEGFNRLRTLISHPDAPSLGLSPSPSIARNLSNNVLQTQNQYQGSFSAGLVRSGPGMPTANGTVPRAPVFKLSPFFAILEPLTPVLECKVPVRDATRDSVQAIINFRSEIAEKLSREPDLRVMIYCAADTVSSPFQKADISFPYQVEIRVNQDEVKSNLRGLKNKPGSTRPADITGLLRKRAGYENHMLVTYALTQKKFFIVVNLVKQKPVGELVSMLKAGQKISKEQVISEMISRAEDNDIIATSSIMSLKCPLSTMRIDVPCRSTICSHNQCFDANSFLQLQEQAPTWTCPVCNKAATFDKLEVDQYVDDILQSTPKSVDQVIVEPNGNWSQSSGKTLPQNPSNGRASSDDGDDLVEITDMPRVASVKREAIRDSGMMRTPPISSREHSTASAPPPTRAPPSQTSNKRSSGQVVDLTNSSDEDEEPIRGPKRQAHDKSSNSLSNFPGLENAPLRPNGATSGASKPRHYSSNPFPTSNYVPRDYGQAS